MKQFILECDRLEIERLRKRRPSSSVHLAPMLHRYVPDVPAGHEIKDRPFEGMLDWLSGVVMNAPIENSKCYVDDDRT